MSRGLGHARGLSIHISPTQFAYILTFLICCSGGFSTIPLTSLIEAAVCRNVDPEGSPSACKDNGVQTRVVNILAVEASIESVVGLLVTVPWSAAVKKFRRNRILLLAFIGVMINELWWIAVLFLQPLVQVELGWLSSLGLLCGGGAPVIMAQIHTIVAEAEPEEHRSIAFTRIHVASMLGNLLAPGLASILVRVTGHVEVGLWLGVLCVVGAACLLPCIPDTPPVLEDLADPVNRDDGVTQPLLDTSEQAVMTRTRSLYSIPLAALFLALTLLAPIGPSTTQFLVQFAAKRYNLNIADMGFVLAFYGSLQLFQALVLLPLISRYFSASHEDEGNFDSKQADQHRDGLITRALVFVLVPGLLIVAMAPTLTTFLAGLTIMALGSAHGSYVTSLMVNYVDRAHRPTLFGFTAMVDVAGTIYSAFLLAKLFKIGMNTDGILTGIPYLVLAGFVVVAELALLFVKPLRRIGQDYT